MRFHLPFLALTFLFSPSLSSPGDVLYIKELTADFAINLDAKNFNAFDSEFIPTATYDPGPGPVTGIPNIKKALAGIVVGNVTQSSLTTQSISLSPTFDTQGSASRASATTYAIVSYIGQRADAGKVFIVYGLFKDQLVKTGDFGDYGGWRFRSRVFQSLVSAVWGFANPWILTEHLSGYGWRSQRETCYRERELKAVWGHK